MLGVKELCGRSSPDWDKLMQSSETGTISAYNTYHLGRNSLKVIITWLSAYCSGRLAEPYAYA